MDPTAVVPVRATPAAKLRLAHALPASVRVELVGRLFAHTVGVLSDAALRVVVVCAGPMPAVPEPVEVVADPGRGLDAAVRAGLEVAGLPALVVPADLPWISVSAVEQLLAELGDVVVVRSDDGGTNGLVLRRRFAPAFGPRSALVHAARARACGLRARVLDGGRSWQDLDDERALRRALGRSPALPSRSLGPG